MHPFLYAMRMRGLRHGSEEEYDMFEEFAICRAKNRRMNGAAESRLQLEPPAPSVAHTTRRDEHLVQADSSSAAAPEDGNCCSQLEKDPALATTTESPPSAPHTTPAKGAVGNVTLDNGPHVYTLDAQEHSPQPDPPSTSSTSAVLQITIQVRSAQKKKKCGEHAVCNESPLQAGGDELE